MKSARRDTVMDMESSPKINRPRLLAISLLMLLARAAGASPVPDLSVADLSITCTRCQRTTKHLMREGEIQEIARHRRLAEALSRRSGRDVRVDTYLYCIGCNNTAQYLHKPGVVYHAPGTPRLIVDPPDGRTIHLYPNLVMYLDARLNLSLFPRVNQDAFLKTLTGPPAKAVEDSLSGIETILGCDL